jgi:hypothetical protein
LIEEVHDKVQWLAPTDETVLIGKIQQKKSQKDHENQNQKRKIW